MAEIKGISTAQAALPAEHPMRLFGEAVEAQEPARKRLLEDDEDVYAARKQQLLKKIAQETIQEPELFGSSRMKYSLAYKGGFEASDRANFDTWTYPAEMGAQVLQAAFDRLT